MLELAGLHRSWQAFSRAWVTLDRIDVLSILEGEEVFYAHGPTVRNAGNLLRNFAAAWQTLRRMRPAVILTTGSALAVPYALLGRVFGSRVVYVECAGRADRASLACRLIAPFASRVYVQWPGLLAALPDATYAGRVNLCGDRRFDGMTAAPWPAIKVLVTVGTCEFQFDRLVLAADTFPDRAGVLVQTGWSQASTKNVTGVDYLPFDDLAAYMRQADIVITHAGIGSVLLAHANGKRPIVVPRRKELGENVDDHQIAFARAMAAEGLITLVEDPGDLPALLAAGVDCALPTTAPADGMNLAEDLLAYLTSLLHPAGDKTPAPLPN